MIDYFGGTVLRLIYYFFIKPLSLLPMPMLYWLSNLLFAFSHVGLSYRKNVVASNLSKAFPSKSERERDMLQSKFYRYFYDLVIESIKLFSISKQEALSRFKVMNPEMLDPLIQSDKSAILTGGHYTNWELFAVATDPQIAHQLVGVYTPLTNAFMEKKFSSSRSRFGLSLAPKRELKNIMKARENELTLTTFAIDQSPRADQRAYWLNFLGQETAVHFGTEKYAKEYNLPVIYGKSKRVKRGYYELTFELVTDNPLATATGEITTQITKKLEDQILEAPEYWLWTHNRWKLSNKKADAYASA
ncbi:MAG: lysophospholipid acyltransferase family protein [Cyclobacteriaceae bacterium]